MVDEWIHKYKCYAEDDIYSSERKKWTNTTEWRHLVGIRRNLPMNGYYILEGVPPKCRKVYIECWGEVLFAKGNKQV